MVGRERVPFDFSTASFDFKQEGTYRGPRQSKVLWRPEIVVVVGGTTPRGTTVRRLHSELGLRSGAWRLTFKGHVGVGLFASRPRTRRTEGSKAIRGARGVRQTNTKHDGRRNKKEEVG